MRKNSRQILEEIRLDQELARFKYKDELKKAIDDMVNFRVNELDALHKMHELTKNNKVLGNYVASIIIEHSRNIMAVLGVTVEGWKTEIENLEEKRNAYAKTRNNIKSRMDKEPN